MPQSTSSAGVVRLTAPTKRSRASSRRMRHQPARWKARSARASPTRGNPEARIAEALQAIEIGGAPVKAFAEAKGLSSNNAAVRGFRAREALKKRVTES